MLVSLTQNTIAQYKMNDNSPTSTVVDSQESNDGTYVGEDTGQRSVEGVVNRALGFNGSPDYVDTNQTFETIFKDSFTINFWAKPDDGIPSGVEFMSGVRDVTNTNQVLVALAGSSLFFIYSSNANSVVNVTSSTFSNGPAQDYKMFTCIVENTAPTAKASVYINGELVSEDTDTVDMGAYSLAFNFFLGATNHSTIGDNGHYNGDIDIFSIFNKAISQDEIDFLYNNGFGTELLIGSSGVDEYSSPTLTYPVGGEQLTHNTIQIEWDEPLLLAQGNNKLMYWYEIFYSIDSISEDNRFWYKIADVPSGNSVFNWKIPHQIRSDNCRVGIRTVDSRGGRTPMIMSPNVFSIQNRILPSPAIFSPLDGDRFFTYIPVIFDQEGLAGQFPKRAHYRISYSSSNQETDWISIGDNIPIATSETFLDVSGLASDDDYSLKFELIDGENSSAPVFINNITINNLNFFKIDTVPPTGVIRVRGNSEYIKDRDTILELTAYDTTTGTESFRISQKELDYINDPENPNTISPLYPMSDISSWRIVNDDGIKLIQVSFVDFAGNALEPISSKFFFRTYKSVDNREVTSLLVNKNGDSYDVWQAIGGTAPELYLNGTSVVGAEATGTPSYLPSSVVGNSLDYEQRYNVEGLGSIDVDFEAYSIQDRLVIEGGGSVLEDTGLISGSTSFNLTVVGLSEIIVKVTSNSSGTGWNYSIDSKDEYPLSSDFYNTAASRDNPEGEILSMAIYNDVLYLGEETKEANGLLQRYTGGHIESVYEITTLDSAINAMIVFDSNLFIACANGELYSFNGTTAQLENTFESGLNKIGTDGNLLYIFLENSTDIYTAYKNSLGELNYVKTTLE